MDFRKELKEYQNIVEDELKKYIKKEACIEKILNESVEYSLMAGGKRLRPILVIATYQLFKSDYEKVLPFAVAIEMVHNFSLIHDDLPAIDDDDFRHGKLTNHKKFTEATAILAGDSLLNQAYIVIANNLKNIENNYELGLRIDVFKEFSEAIDKMILGEYLDTEYEGKEINYKYLEYIHENKTAALLTLCVRMGAILAGADSKDIDNLTAYAKKIGLAFQIKDDILSVEGNELITGKPVGKDEQKGKCTYVSKYGLEESKKILENIINEVILKLEIYGQKAEFLKELAIYIKDRNK